jgi:porphobilinogen synthase
MRRLRRNSSIRDLVADHYLHPSNLVQPFFIIEGKNLSEPIETLPGINRISIDILIDEVKKAINLGIRAIMLFPAISEDKKDEEGTESYNVDNLLCRSIREIKSQNLDITIICDVALDPYTSHGHDGIVRNDEVDNDETIEVLVAQSLALASAGADIIAPSDMMDGRIGEIRDALEESGYHNVAILSYAIKYASNLYGPFRDAVKSKQNKGLEVDKSTYQADYRTSSAHAIREVELDIAEGADMVVVKPASYYLDIISNVSMSFNVPVFAYQVSGEYAMIKFAAEKKALQSEINTMFEALTAFKRAGASAIISYAAMEVASILNNKQ